LKPILVALALMAGLWGVLVVLAARLPPGLLKDLAGFLPACVTLARRLRADPRVSWQTKAAVVVAGLWVLSPIDLVPEFLPVIGPLDDVVVVALALRYEGDALLAALDAGLDEERVLGMGGRGADLGVGEVPGRALGHGGVVQRRVAVAAVAVQDPDLPGDRVGHVVATGPFRATLRSPGLSLSRSAAGDSSLR
jgi:uncharacterized membrane protein YkvA (DUF1232 family)